MYIYVHSRTSNIFIEHFRRHRVTASYDDVIVTNLAKRSFRMKLFF